MTETATVTFTLGDVANEVRRLADEAPTFVYHVAPEADESGEEFIGGCSYLTGSEGKGCIVGQALVNLGVSTEFLAEAEGEHALRVLHRLGLVESDSQFEAEQSVEALWVLEVQSNQDLHRAWADAVRLADERIYTETDSEV